MKISIKILEEVDKRLAGTHPILKKVELSFSVRHRETGNPFGFVVMADDVQDYVISAFPQSWIKDEFIMSKRLYPYLNELTDENNIPVYRFIKQPVKILYFDANSSMEGVDRSLWYDELDKIIKEILKEKPELEWAV